MFSRTNFSLIIAFAFLAALSSCSSSSNDNADDYCTDAGILLKGGLYYNNYDDCMSGDYAQKSLLVAVLDKYINDPDEMAAFADAVCRTFPVETHEECYSGVFAMPGELTGFRNILQSQSSDRSSVCYMAQETAGFVVFYMLTYSQAECSSD